MKQPLFITIGALFTGILILTAGCGGAGSAAGFAREDLSLQIGGVEYRCDMDIQEVIADLGEDYAYSEGMSCDYDGLDKSFRYAVAQFYTNPLAAGDLINEIYTEDPAVSTSRGIVVGAAREAVLAAYGEDCEDLGYLLIYSIPGERASLCFELEDGVVWAIYLTTQPV